MKIATIVTPRARGAILGHTCGAKTALSVGKYFGKLTFRTSVVICGLGVTLSHAQSTNQTPNAADLLPNDPFVTVTTRFSCAHSQSLTISARVPPKMMSVEFDDKLGIITTARADGSSQFDAASATIAAERVTGYASNDYLNRRVDRSGTRVGSDDAFARFVAGVENKRRAELADRLGKSQERFAGKKLSRDDLAKQRDAYEDMMDSLSKQQPITIKHKYKTYKLSLERGYAGFHYINRAQGVDWTVRQRVGTLKNPFSGRVIASQCRQSSKLESEAEEPVLTNAR